MALKSVLLVALLTLLVLTTTTLCVTAKTTQSITGSFTVSKGNSKYDDFTYDMTGMSKATGNVVVGIADAEISGGGLTFYGYDGVPSASVHALNLSMANSAVTDTSIALQGCPPRYSQFFISNTIANMTGTTPLFLFTDVVPQWYIVIDIIDTDVSWPESGDGGDLLRLAGSKQLIPKWWSAIYVTRANAYNAATIWNVLASISKVEYFVDVREDSMWAIDYVNCYNCKKAFIYSSVTQSPPVVGSEKCYVRFSNCTQTGKTPFFAARSQETFSFGPNNGNIAFSGITTDGALFSFQNAAWGQVKRYTMLAMMHIKADSSGLDKQKLFPVYLPEGYKKIPDCHVFMGNITLGNTLLSTPNDFNAARLYPKYIVDDYSRFKWFGKATEEDTADKDYPYSSGDYTAVYCAMGGGVESIGIETLGNEANGGKRWTRPKCVCKSGYTMPYCVPVAADPLLYYAGYTFGLDGCNVENCTKCWWGLPDKCTQCDPTFMLYPAKWSCVPNICGECPDDGNIYTYTGGVCVVNNVSNCATVNGDGACIACNESYSLYNGKCWLCNVENCAICSSDNVCHQCNTDQSYTIDSTTGKCVYCGDNCKTCTSSGCTACNTGYTLTPNNDCTSACTITGCTTCASSTACSACDSGLTLTAAGQCTCNIANCETCFGSKCKACSYGFYYNVLKNTCVTVASVVKENGSAMIRATIPTFVLLALIFVVA